MESTEKQDITTGRQHEPKSILASADVSTAEPLKAAPTKKENASIEIALTLALLQSDFSDLQSRGLKVSILARDGKLYASIEWPDHPISVSDTAKKSILLDGKPVVEYE